MRKTYIEELKNLDESLLKFGSMAEKILTMAVDALVNHDIELALATINFEKQMDTKYMEIEQNCISILALQQPVAKDLRKIVAIIKILSDIERIGDLSEDIADIVVAIGKEKYIKPLLDIPKLYNVCKQMISSSLDCYARKDEIKAYKIYAMDDLADRLFSLITTDIMNLANENLDYIYQGMQFMMVARYLERIADHATNICEGINYIVTGDMSFEEKEE